MTTTIKHTAGKIYQLDGKRYLCLRVTDEGVNACQLIDSDSFPITDGLTKGRRIIGARIGEMIQEKIKVVVIDEHVLGYITPENPNYARILHSSVLRGSPHPEYGQIAIAGKTVRLADAADFTDYRVSAFGYQLDPENYEMA